MNFSCNNLYKIFKNLKNQNKNRNPVFLFLYFCLLFREFDYFFVSLYKNKI